MTLTDAREPPPVMVCRSALQLDSWWSARRQLIC